MRIGLAVFTAFCLPVLSLPAFALADEASLESYQWTNRPVIIFADSPRDPRFVDQMADLERRQADLDDRDVVLLTDTDPAAKGPLRQKLRPRGFQLVLIGKDGEIKLRTPHPIEADALSRLIDRMPMRKQEMRGGQD